MRGEQAYCVWIILSVWPRRGTTTFGKEERTEISFLPFLLHNFQQNYLMPNHLLYRTVILPKYHLINGWNRIQKEIAFYFSFFPGTNAVVLDTKPWEKWERVPASSPCSQRLEAVGWAWFHDIFSDSSFSLPDSAVPDHRYVASHLKAHWQFIRLQRAYCIPIYCTLYGNSVT